MKKLLCIIGITATIASTTSSMYFGINSNNLRINVESGNKQEISTKLSDFFERTKNTDLIQSRTRAVNKDLDDSFVLDYIEYDYESSFLFLNLEDMKEDGVNRELISILQLDEFSYELNLAFQQGLFEYVGNRVVYVPYEEIAKIEKLNLNNQDDISLFLNARNSSQNNPSIRIFTRWFWFGVFRIELNNAIIQEINEIIFLARPLTAVLNLILVLLGPAVATFHIVVKILTRYVMVIMWFINNTNERNNRRGVFLWASTIILAGAVVVGGSL